MGRRSKHDGHIHPTRQGATSYTNSEVNIARALLSTYFTSYLNIRLNGDSDLVDQVIRSLLSHTNLFRMASTSGHDFKARHSGIFGTLSEAEIVGLFSASLVGDTTPVFGEQSEANLRRLADDLEPVLQGIHRGLTGNPLPPAPAFGLDLTVVGDVIPPPHYPIPGPSIMYAGPSSQAAGEEEEDDDDSEEDGSEEDDGDGSDDGGESEEAASLYGAPTPNGEEDEGTDEDEVGVSHGADSEGHDDLGGALVPTADSVEEGDEDAEQTEDVAEDDEMVIVSAEDVDSAVPYANDASQPNQPIANSSDWRSGYSEGFSAGVAQRSTVGAASASPAGVPPSLPHLTFAPTLHLAPAPVAPVGAQPVPSAQSFGSAAAAPSAAATDHAAAAVAAPFTTPTWPNGLLSPYPAFPHLALPGSSSVPFAQAYGVNGFAPAGAFGGPPAAGAMYGGYPFSPYATAQHAAAHQHALATQNAAAAQHAAAQYMAAASQYPLPPYPLSPLSPLSLYGQPALPLQPVHFPWAFPPFPPPQPPPSPAPNPGAGPDGPSTCQ